MKKLLFILLIFPFISLADVNICYFSLNNEKEVHTVRNFTEKISKNATEKIIVTEYQEKGSNPKDSFKAMVESGQQCDGLVISGHHTGSFGGKRASGSLSIEFLEEMACDPKYKDWFNKISALWLQGCRTLGVNIEADDLNNSADYHMNRVGAVLEEDHLDQNYEELNAEFSNTLDQENPLSSRYMRVFASASVFGWTKTAPGVKARSENSIPYHIAHITRLMDDRREYFQDPLDKNMSAEVAANYSEVLLGILNRRNYEAKGCDILVDEDTAVEGWLYHGQAKGKGLPFSYQNPDLQAVPSLAHGGNPLLGEAKRLDCLFKQDDITNKEIEEVLDLILSDERYLGYSFNSLWEYIKRLDSGGKFEQADLIRKRMASSQTLKQFLMKKMSSPQLGILRKIDYYKFYTDVTGEENFSIEKQIKDRAFALLLQEYNGNPYSISFKETLTQSIAKNDFLNTEDIIYLNSHKTREARKVVSKLLELNPSKIEGAADILLDIANNADSKEEYQTLKSVLEAINGKSADFYTKSERGKIINHYLNPKSGIDLNFLRYSAIKAIAGNETGPINNADKIYRKLISADKSNALPIMQAIAESKIDFPNGNKIINENLKNIKNRNEIASLAVSFLKGNNSDKEDYLLNLIKHSNNDSYSQRKIAKHLLRGSNSLKNEDVLVLEMLNSQTVDDDLRYEIAKSFELSKREILGANKILKELSKSTTPDTGSRRVLVSLRRSNVTDVDEILVNMLANEKDNLYDVSWILGHKEVLNKIQTPEVILNQLIDSPHTSYAVLSNVTRALQEKEFDNKIKLELIRKLRRSDQFNKDMLPRLNGVLLVMQLDGDLTRDELKEIINEIK
jgi:hypothetical protein